MQHVPTKHPRIAVTKDPELAAALAAVRSDFEGQPEATVLRALALRGAEALAGDEARRRRLTDELARWATDPASGMDRDALRTVRDTAWRRQA